MRKKWAVLLVLLFGISSLMSQEAWTDRTRVLPDKLRKIPEAAFIYHDPNPNYPEKADPKDGSDYTYVWKHQTSVISPEKNLTVIEAGSFIWYSEAGWMENVQLSRKDFAKRFNCPKGLLKAGVRYTFVKNYRYGDNLYGGDALWFVLAEDENGTVYRGLSILETESELK